MRRGYRIAEMRETLEKLDYKISLYEQGWFKGKKIGAPPAPI
jgi:hypothetical protein